MGSVLSKDDAVRAALSLRFIPVCLVFLPLGFLLRVYSKVRRLFLDLLGRVLKHSGLITPSSHADRVAFVQQQVIAKKVNLCTARPALFMTTMRSGSYKEKRNTVDLSALHNILELDVDARTVRVEPMVSMLALTRFLNGRGWTLPVVPELDDLTVGGLVSGYGIESSSHKWGLFGDTVREVELVVASGDSVVCQPGPHGQHSDLFAAIGWSLGALGFIVGITLSIIPCSQFVKVRYEPLCSHAAMVQAFSNASHSPDKHEFVECLVFGPDKGVLITGSFSDFREDLPVNHLRRPWSEWFYKQVARMPLHEELIPLNDWYHRHTASLFWEMELILPFGNSWLFRYLMGWMMPINIPLLKMTHIPLIEGFYEASHTAQDFLVPLSVLSEALKKADQIFEIYPLWLCPHLVKESPIGGSVRSRKDGIDEMFVDVGVYGVSQRLHRDPKAKWHARKAVAEYEQWLLEIGGYSALYANVELKAEDFDRMFDRKLHESMRLKWGAAGVFRDTYDKVKA